VWLCLGRHKISCEQIFQVTMSKLLGGVISIVSVNLARP
jgi:hypothetical protein